MRTAHRDIASSLIIAPLATVSRPANVPAREVVAIISSIARLLLLGHLNLISLSTSGAEDTDSSITPAAEFRMFPE